MEYAYLTGYEQPDQDIVMPEGQAIGGHALGILVIDIWYPLLPGNVANASTFGFPVLYKVLKGASIDQILSGDPALLDIVIEAGRDLIRHGVRAIVGACGSFAYYQKEAAAALDVPTFLSGMLQVPLILESLKPDQKLGVLAASNAAITEKVFHQCGITDPTRLIITGVSELSEFQKLLQCTGRFNSHKMGEEVVKHVKQFIENNPDVGAMLIQCSDLPPYAWAIQNAIKLPVFDMNSLIQWIYYSVVRQPYRGFI